MAGTADSGDRGPGMPRWVKICGIAVIAVVLLIVVMLLIGGEHSPSRHLQGAGPGVPGTVVVNSGNALSEVRR
ncbi:MULTISPECIES: hypothetical protein [Streptomyces]|uniref:Uncharacterized protein n=1 Tax=Streptomyces antibioticus TaxID=1890 RepID=A0AAE7CI75_STRAT|nr:MULTISPECIES: hypothetical protein [Streptomyces]GLV95146.1 hypothetical protein Slala04_65990 [Streptomyces lavendulae subsp. lavendulae]KOU18321.1 hypothetical protein ADK49_12800 [Streptomyces sp. WM6349]KOV50557.1 hypothetical protein ADK98_08735 [Streptomyces sp. H036]MCX5167377.1 hypothetical protein [Streptomyces antibioticus]OOQ54018.1 hypothetical protein AFM16_05300 [Streptomyces antibioticus]